MRRTNLQLKLAYGRGFGLHNVNSVLVYNQQKTTSGSAIPSALMGYAARVEYGYADRYLAELSIGYNGSGEFRSRTSVRYISFRFVGLRHFEEPFMKKVKKFLPYLKLRGNRSCG